MSRHLILFFFFISSSILHAQIKGQVLDINDKGLASVNIYIENTYKGTTTNEEGLYELNIESKGEYVVVFQFLGYKTLKKSVTIDQLPFKLDVVLEEENISLDEVVVKSDENPANKIIRAAIENRKANLAKIDSYKADFYSRGLIRIKDAPEKILGQEIGDLGGGLDSTRSGIIYLSETISKIDFLKPDKLKEKIIGSKVSGDDNGFSFNAALDVDFNFYFNTVEIGNEIVSPIADYAFNYYNFKLEGVFYDERGNLINKINVIPKRENDRVFSGDIYIVEDQWTIYGLELELTGNQAQIPAADIITLNQTYSYSESDDIWALFSQRIGFKYGLFGIKGSGAFTAVYSNYEFNPQIDRKEFGKEILSFGDEANKKDSLYWQKQRAVPLTVEETQDYIRKDSIQILRKSKKYLDSLDLESNRFKITDLISGYNYQNSYKKYNWEIGSPLEKIKFNTVQGFNTELEFYYRKNLDEFRRYFQLNTSVGYGFSDERILARISAFYKFNNIKRNSLSASAGVSLQQFNSGLGSLERLNSFYSLLAEENYLKLYELHYLQIGYSQEVFNGLRMSTTLSYQKRVPRFNATDQVWFNRDGRDFTSNNPLDPDNYNTALFEEHHILKFALNSSVTFGQRYMSYPDSKFNIPNEKYPTLNLGYETGFNSDVSDYNFHQLKLRLFQTLNFKNKGNTTYNFKLGTFISAEDIAYMDYQHFNGNQTNIGTSFRYTNVFNNMPYYQYSTNKAYAEFHLEHDFSGFILGKMPLLNKLNYNLIIGAHILSTEANKPYQEFSVGLDNIGWGKFRFLRLDYVRSYSSGFKNDALIFGIKFLNFID